MTAITFRLHRLDTGRHAAFGLICTEARYASLVLPGVAALVRRYARAVAWREVEHETAVGLNPAPLAAASAIAQLLADGEVRSTAVQYVTAFEITAAPADVTAALDAHLRAQQEPAA